MDDIKVNNTTTAAASYSITIKKNDRNDCDYILIKYFKNDIDKFATIICRLLS